MIQAFYFSGILVFIFGSIFFGFKCWEWLAKLRISRYQTNLQHFLSDLYRLQAKWAGAGEFGYSESLGNLIKLHGNVSPERKPGGVDMPLTNDGLSNEIQLKNLRKEEFKQFATEFIG